MTAGFGLRFFRRFARRCPLAPRGENARANRRSSAKGRPLGSGTSFELHIILAVFAEGGGPARFNHSLVELNSARRAHRHEAPVLILFFAGTGDRSASDNVGQLPARLFAAQPGFTVEIADLLKLRCVDPEKA